MWIGKNTNFFLKEDQGDVSLDIKNIHSFGHLIINAIPLRIKQAEIQDFV